MTFIVVCPDFTYTRLDSANKCYKVYTDDMDGAGALATCQNDGAIVAEPMNQAELDNILNMGSTNVLLGIFRPGGGGGIVDTVTDSK